MFLLLLPPVVFIQNEPLLFCGVSVCVTLSQNMEKFKVCEKEMKTKAFSKEGLQQAALAKDEDPNTETKKW